MTVLGRGSNHSCGHPVDNVWCGHGEDTNADAADTPSGILRPQCGSERLGAERKILPEGRGNAYPVELPHTKRTVDRGCEPSGIKSREWLGSAS